MKGLIIILICVFLGGCSINDDFDKSMLKLQDKCDGLVTVTAYKSTWQKAISVSCQYTNKIENDKK